MSHVLLIHMPDEVPFRHVVPTMLTHEPSFLKGRSESQKLSQNGETVSDLGEISNGPAQQRGLVTHEGIKSHSFREDFDEIVDF